MPIHQSPNASDPTFLPLTLPPEAAGLRLDAWLAASRPERSRNEWKRLIDAGQVMVNGRAAPRALVLAAGMRLETSAAPSGDCPLRPDAGLGARLPVVFRDATLLVIDKPAGLPCHPLKAGEGGTVINGIIALAPEAAHAGPKPLEGGLVHRLDTQTSGLLAIALDPAAWRHLQADFKAHRVEKRYLAIVEGDLAASRNIDWPIAHHARTGKRMVAVEPGRRGPRGQPDWRGTPRPAQSRVRVLQRLGSVTLVEVTVVQAQMHQIRVHLAAIGHPLVADAVYGSCPARGLARHALHAWRLRLPHPVDGGLLELCAPLPPDLAQLLVDSGSRQSPVA